MAARCNLDTKTRGRKTDEGLEIIRRLWAEDEVDFEGVHYRLTGRLDQPEAGAARSADVDRRLVGRRRSGAPRDLAPAGRRAARRRDEIGAVIAAIREAAIAEGRPIDDDHYGAGFAFRFGRPDDPGLERLLEAYRARTGRDPQRAFRDRRRRRRSSSASPRMSTAGVSKFILRPAARGDARCWRRRGG